MKTISYTYVLLPLLFLIACNFESDSGTEVGKKVEESVKAHPLIIFTYKSNSVERWIEGYDRDVDVRFLSEWSEDQNQTIALDSTAYYLELADGILVPGGADVNPEYYGKQDEIAKCEFIDYFRDSMDFIGINYSLENNIPLLGICRGEQIINVAAGGSLFTDIPTDVSDSISHRDTAAGWSNVHEVTLVEGSMLKTICDYDKLPVVSYHHQGIDRIADIFVAAAYSNDSIVEAIELKDKSKHPFVLAIQWHPEQHFRREQENKVADPIRKEFLEKAFSHMKGAK